jgi:putative methyltransferase (TIGR04325 family)
MISIIMGNIGTPRKLKVLDFGGGLGVGYFHLQECMPKVKSNILYKIVEVPEIVEEGKKFYKNLNLPVSFAKNIPRIKYDFVFCGSVLQYIKNWRYQLHELSQTDPEYILLGDVFCGEIDSFASLQNYYDSKIPHWFLSKREIENQLASLGYNLIHQDAATGSRAGHEDTLPMENFKKKHRLPNTLHLLFQKNKSN